MAETVETVSRKTPVAVGEAGETWKVWLRWGFTLINYRLRAKIEGMDKELILPPWASTFLFVARGAQTFPLSSLPGTIFNESVTIQYNLLHCCA